MAGCEGKPFDILEKTGEHESFLLQGNGALPGEIKLEGILDPVALVNLKI